MGVFPPGEGVVELRSVTKTFGRTRALDGLDLTVRAGEIHGFLGPNGAGKSTAIRVLLGLLRADQGDTRVFGLDPWSRQREVNSRLAYVPGDVTLWPNLTGGEAIDLILRVRGFDPRRTRRDELIERFDFDPSKHGRAYSKGNRQKVPLIAALATLPELLVLDEPTSGLDPLMEQIFADLVREAARSGTTVLLSSHILSEVEALCDQVTIVRDGVTVEAGSLAELRRLRRTRVTAVVTGPTTGLDQVSGVHDLSVRAEGDTWQISLQADAASLTDVFTILGAAGIRSLVSAPASLEELFLEVYRAPGAPDD